MRMCAFFLNDVDFFWCFCVFWTSFFSELSSFPDYQHIFNSMRSTRIIFAYRHIMSSIFSNSEISIALACGRSIGGIPRGAKASWSWFTIGISSLRGILVAELGCEGRISKNSSTKGSPKGFRQNQTQALRYRVLCFKSYILTTAYYFSDPLERRTPDHDRVINKTSPEAYTLPCWRWLCAVSASSAHHQCSSWHAMDSILATCLAKNLQPGTQTATRFLSLGSTTKLLTILWYHQCQVLCQACQESEAVPSTVGPRTANSHSSAARSHESARWPYWAWPWVTHTGWHTSSNTDSDSDPFYYWQQSQPWTASY